MIESITQKLFSFIFKRSQRSAFLYPLPVFKLCNSEFIRRPRSKRQTFELCIYKCCFPPARARGAQPGRESHRQGARGARYGRLALAARAENADRAAQRTHLFGLLVGAVHFAIARAAFLVLLVLGAILVLRVLEAVRRAGGLALLLEHLALVAPA